MALIDPEYMNLIATRHSQLYLSLNRDWPLDVRDTPSPLFGPGCIQNPVYVVAFSDNH